MGGDHDASEPAASRPYMPGYGILPETEGSGLLPWSWAADRLRGSHDYWLATTWPDGRPHVMPVWGVWERGCAWFSSSGHARKARNMAVNPQAVITTDNALQPVVVEGVVERVGDLVTIEAFTGWVNAKYDTDYGVDFFRDNACFRLRPVWAFGLEDGDFTGTPTKWEFAGR